METFPDFKLPLNYFINILTNKQVSSSHIIILLQNLFEISHSYSLVVKLPSSFESHKLVIDNPFDLLGYNLLADFEPITNLKTLGLEQI